MLSVEQMLRIDSSLAAIECNEVEELRQVLYETAQLASELYWLKRHGSKYPVGLFTDTAPKTNL